MDIVQDIVRNIFEKCDHLNGFQIFSDCDSGFGYYWY